MTAQEQSERLLVGCILGQMDAEGARRAAATGLEPRHFADAECAALFRAAVHFAPLDPYVPPLVHPDLVRWAETRLNRPIEPMEVQSLVDRAPPSAEAIPGLARSVMEGHARRSASAALESAFQQLGNGHSADEIAAAVRDAMDTLEAGGARREPRVEPKPIAALVRHAQGEDPDELLRRRFLCRGGALLLVGPTGVGKSSLAMQAALLWSLGLHAFGIEPARPLRILIIQAENDEGDMAEMRDGVLGGLSLRDADRDAACAGVQIVTEDCRTRERFTSFLDGLLERHPTDLVIVDPAFAYLGGDASSQRDVSPFLRNMLNPVIHRHNVGLIMVHHSNKPATGDQKAQWQAGDYAYLGAGSAEFANWARGVIALRSIGSDTVFQLLAPKRGRRLGWVDDRGQPTVVRHIAYHREPGVICWREPDAAEMIDLHGDGRPTIRDVVDALEGGQAWQKDLVAAMIEKTDLKRAKVYELIAEAVRNDAVRIVQTGPKGAQLLRATGKIPPRPAMPAPSPETHPEEGHEDDPEND